MAPVRLELAAPRSRVKRSTTGLPIVMLSLWCLIVLIPDLCPLSYFMATCWERADLLALVGDGYCIFVTLPCGILGQVWYLIVSFSDLCHLLYFGDINKSIWFALIVFLMTYDC